MGALQSIKCLMTVAHVSGKWAMGLSRCKTPSLDALELHSRTARQFHHLVDGMSS